MNLNDDIETEPDHSKKTEFTPGVKEVSKRLYEWCLQDDLDRLKTHKRVVARNQTLGNGGTWNNNKICGYTFCLIPHYDNHLLPTPEKKHTPTNVKEKPVKTIDAVLQRGGRIVNKGRTGVRRLKRPSRKASRDSVASEKVLVIQRDNFCKQIREQQPRVVKEKEPFSVPYKHGVPLQRVLREYQEANMYSRARLTKVNKKELTSAIMIARPPDANYNRDLPQSEPKKNLTRPAQGQRQASSLMIPDSPARRNPRPQGRGGGNPHEELSVKAITLSRPPLPSPRKPSKPPPPPLAVPKQRTTPRQRQPPSRKARERQTLTLSVLSIDSTSLPTLHGERDERLRYPARATHSEQLDRRRQAQIQRSNPMASRNTLRGAKEPQYNGRDCFVQPCEARGPQDVRNRERASSLNAMRAVRVPTDGSRFVARKYVPGPKFLATGSFPEAPPPDNRRYTGEPVNFNPARREEAASEEEGDWGVSDANRKLALKMTQMAEGNKMSDRQRTVHFVGDRRHRVTERTKTEAVNKRDAFLLEKQSGDHEEVTDLGEESRSSTNDESVDDTRTKLTKGTMELFSKQRERVEEVSFKPYYDERPTSINRNKRRGILEVHDKRKNKEDGRQDEEQRAEHDGRRDIARPAAEEIRRVYEKGRRVYEEGRRTEIEEKRKEEEKGRRQIIDERREARAEKREDRMENAGTPRGKVLELTFEQHEVYEILIEDDDDVSEEPPPSKAVRRKPGEIQEEAYDAPESQSKAGPFKRQLTSAATRGGTNNTSQAIQTSTRGKSSGLQRELQTVVQEIKAETPTSRHFPDAKRQPVEREFAERDVASEVNEILSPRFLNRRAIPSLVLGRRRGPSKESQLEAMIAKSNALQKKLGADPELSELSRNVYRKTVGREPPQQAEARFLERQSLEMDRKARSDFEAIENAQYKLEMDINDRSSFKLDRNTQSCFTTEIHASRVLRMDGNPRANFEDRLSHSTFLKKYELLPHSEVPLQNKNAHVQSKNAQPHSKMTQVQKNAVSESYVQTYSARESWDLNESRHPNSPTTNNSAISVGQRHEKRNFISQGDQSFENPYDKQSQGDQTYESPYNEPARGDQSYESYLIEQSRGVKRHESPYKERTRGDQSHESPYNELCQDYQRYETTYGKRSQAVQSPESHCNEQSGGEQSYEMPNDEISWSVQRYESVQQRQRNGSPPFRNQSIQSRDSSRPSHYQTREDSANAVGNVSYKRLESRAQRSAAKPALHRTDHVQSERNVGQPTTGGKNIIGLALTHIMKSRPTKTVATININDNVSFEDKSMGSLNRGLGPRKQPRFGKNNAKESHRGTTKLTDLARSSRLDVTPNVELASRAASNNRYIRELDDMEARETRSRSTAAKKGPQKSNQFSELSKNYAALLSKMRNVNSTNVEYKSKKT